MSTQKLYNATKDLIAYISGNVSLTGIAVSDNKFDGLLCEVEAALDEIDNPKPDAWIEAISKAVRERKKEK